MMQTKDLRGFTVTKSVTFILCVICATQNLVSLMIATLNKITFDEILVTVATKRLNRSLTRCSASDNGKVAENALNRSESAHRKKGGSTTNLLFRSLVDMLKGSQTGIS